MSNQMSIALANFFLWLSVKPFSSGVVMSAACFAHAIGGFGARGKERAKALAARCAERAIKSVVVFFGDSVSKARINGGALVFEMGVFALRSHVFQRAVDAGEQIYAAACLFARFAGVVAAASGVLLCALKLKIALSGAAHGSFLCFAAGAGRVLPCCFARGHTFVGCAGDRLIRRRCSCNGNKGGDKPR
jgi:hypothetical protein